FFLRNPDVLGDVLLAGEIELAGDRLVQVPEDIGRNRVEPHRARLAQSIAPVRAWDAGVMHLAGDDLEGLAVKQERGAVSGERRLLRGAHASCARERDRDEGETTHQMNSFMRARSMLPPLRNATTCLSPMPATRPLSSAAVAAAPAVSVT